MIMGICPDANASTAKKTVKNEQPLKLKQCLNIRKNLFIKWLCKFNAEKDNSFL